MKSGWEFKFADNRWAGGFAASIVLFILVFIHALFSQAGLTFASSFPNVFALDVDLGTCAPWFSRIFMAQMAYALAICLVLFILLLRMTADVAMATRNRWAYWRPMILAVVGIFFLTALATSEHGFWWGRLHRSSLGLTLRQACQLSVETVFVRNYVISASLAVGTWILIMMILFWRRELTRKRNYSDLPTDAALRAEIIEVREKYRDVFQTQKRISPTVAAVAVAIIVVMGIGGIYRLALILGNI